MDRINRIFQDSLDHEIAFYKILSIPSNPVNPVHFDALGMGIMAFGGGWGEPANPSRRIILTQFSARRGSDAGDLAVGLGRSVNHCWTASKAISRKQSTQQRRLRMDRMNRIFQDSQDDEIAFYKILSIPSNPVNPVHCETVGVGMNLPGNRLKDRECHWFDPARSHARALSE